MPIHADLTTTEVEHNETHLAVKVTEDMGRSEMKGDETTEVVTHDANTLAQYQKSVINTHPDIRISQDGLTPVHLESKDGSQASGCRGSSQLLEFQTEMEAW